MRSRSGTQSSLDMTGIREEKLLSYQEDSFVAHWPEEFYVQPLDPNFVVPARSFHCV